MNDLDLHKLLNALRPDGLNGDITVTAHDGSRHTITSAQDAREVIAAYPDETLHLQLVTSSNHRAAYAVWEGDCAEMHEKPTFIIAPEDDSESIFVFMTPLVGGAAEFFANYEGLPVSVPLPGSGGWQFAEYGGGGTATYDEDGTLLKFVDDDGHVWSANSSASNSEPAGVAAGVADPGAFQAIFLNDAVFPDGAPSADVLGIPLKLGFGRGRDDKRWVPQTIKFGDLIHLMSRHEEGQKDGKAFIQGVAVGHQRVAKAMSAMYVCGLDVDCGISREYVIDRLRTLKLASIIYTTHSDSKPFTTINQSSYAKWAKKNQLAMIDPPDADVQRYLREARGWVAEIANSARVTGKAHDVDGVGYKIEHLPIPKFRIVFPLLQPFVIAEQQGLIQLEAINLWKGKLLGLAKIVGVPIDESCLDPSRLFYLARHPKGSTTHSITVTNGQALEFALLPNAAPRNEDAPDEDAYAAAARELGASSQPLMYGDFSLKAWARKVASTFQVCELIRHMAPDRVRMDNGTDKMEIECPFDHEHGNTGDMYDRACYVINAHADGGDKGFVWGCQHNCCRGRDRLEFLCEALKSNWFGTDDLTNEDFRAITIEDGNYFGTECNLANSGGEKFEFTDEMELIEAFNRLYALVFVGRNSIFVEQTGRQIEMRSKQALQDKLANRHFLAGDPVKKTPAFDVWLKSPQRRTYGRVVFEPGGSEPDAFNLWAGFAYARKAGSCRLMKQHMLNVLCDGDTKSFEWWFGWLAQMVQDPGNKPGTAVVVRGAKGTGKSTVADWLWPILSPHIEKVSQPKHLTGNFNAHLERCILVIAEETFWAGDKSAEGVLKDLITGRTVLLERKSVDAVSISNHMRFMMFTNAEWAVPATHDDRRFLVLDASDKHACDKGYFEALYAEADAGGREALFAEFLAFDYSHLDLRNPPKTKAFAKQVAQGFTPGEEWLQSVLDQGEFEGIDEICEGIEDWLTSPLTIPKTYVHRSYQIFAPNYRGRPVAAAQIGKFLAQHIPGLDTYRSTDRRHGGRIWCYVFPPLEQLRAAFTAKFGLPFDDNDRSRVPEALLGSMDGGSSNGAPVTLH